MVVCTHIGSSSQLPRTAPDSPLITSIVLTPMNAISNLVDWLISGALLRFADLKLALSEGGIGWIPYVLERASYTLDRQKFWAAKGNTSLHGEQEGGKVPPGLLEADVYQLFRDHVYGCFIDDIFGADNIDYVGVDNVMAESDYPHTDSNWPHSLETISKRIAGRSDEDKWKILQGNARKLFRFIPATPPA
jgi:predicted TIM-barrel fold metal-dependent hydrolase